MPIYEYQCDRCGTFSNSIPMSRAAEPAACPECGAGSPRIISAPFVAGLSMPLRQAWERNERSAHEPRVSRKSACGCRGAHTCRPAAEPSRVAGAALQASTRTHSRPWMLGH